MGCKKYYVTLVTHLEVLQYRPIWALHVCTLVSNSVLCFCQLSDALLSTPFQALTMSDKAGVMAYVCNELLCSRTICKYVHLLFLDLCC